MPNKKNFFSKDERGIFNKKIISQIIVGVIVAASFVIFMNFDKVVDIMNLIYSLFSPFIAGMAIAYFLNLLLVPVEKKMFGWIKSYHLRRSISLGVTFVIALILISGLIFLIVPQFVESFTQLIANTPGYLNEAYINILAFASRYGVTEQIIDEFVNFDETINYVLDYARSLIPSMVNISLAFGSGIISSIIAVVTAIYILSDKEKLTRNFSIMFKALMSDKVYNKSSEILSRSAVAFSSFLTGKTIDSLIIGLICFIFMVIFGMPYIPMISIIIGVTNMIPTIGPFIGGFPASLIILLVDPIQGLWFGLFVILLQQFDGNILGPKILGETIGISAIWILFSVVFFGSLWGVVGMLIGVPLFAVGYDMFKEFILLKLEHKKQLQKQQEQDNEEFIDD